MRNVIYSMGVSADGYIAGRGGEIDWTAPNEELHRFHNDLVRETGVHLYGRGLYEEMLFWETAQERPLAAEQVEFAEIWKATPKLVFSRTLDSVQGNATLADGDVAEEVTRLKRQDGGDLAVGGAGLAATLIELNLIDEYLLFVSPVVLGGGTPYFPPLQNRLDLELVQTRTFSSRVVHTRYRRR